uniref:Uncharacterized protein n=1 Tax=Oryza punctata TaxID=4537 RepID=A0A0E0MKR4_ORYPU
MEIVRMKCLARGVEEHRADREEDSNKRVKAFDRLGQRVDNNLDVSSVLSESRGLGLDTMPLSVLLREDKSQGDLHIRG